MKSNQRAIVGTLIGIVVGFMALALILDIDFGGPEVALVGGVLTSLIALLASTESNGSTGCCRRKKRAQVAAVDATNPRDEIPTIAPR